MLRSPNSIAKEDKIIEDPAMEPFFITKAKLGGYAIYKRVKKGKNSTEYIQNFGYPSNFNSALKLVSKLLLNTSKNKKYSSIKEYLSEWNEIKNRMESITDLV